VHPSAKLGDEVEIGPYAVVEAGAVIGDRTRIGAHAIIGENTCIGQDCRIFPHAVVGLEPQDLKFKGEKTYLKVGDGTVIREFATLNRGTAAGHRETVVGRECFIMAYAHVAHDCFLGERVILANGATLAGHIIIEDYAIVGGLTPIHQFVRIGKYAMVGGGSGVPMDVVPYALASGNRIRIFGLNVVGLRRHGFSPEVIRTLRQAFRILFFSGLNTSQAVEQLSTEFAGSAEVEYLVHFIRESKRGICRKTPRSKEEDV